MAERTSHLEDITDAALVRQARQGDGVAFDELVRRYRPMLLAFARSWASDREAAEDLTQETLGRAWQKLAALHDPTAFPAWLKTILRNTCRMWVRRSPLRDESWDVLEDGTPGAGEDPLGLLLTVEDMCRRHEALRALPEENRRALLLHVSGQCSYAEIAERLHLPLSTVEGRIQRARRQLRRALGIEAPVSQREKAPSRTTRGGTRMKEMTFDVARVRALRLFTRQLAELLDAGVALPHALHLLTSEAPAPYDKAAQALLVAVARDQSLITAMAEQLALFPEWYRALAAIGRYRHNEMADALRQIVTLLSPVAGGDPNGILGAAQKWTPSLRLLVFTRQLAALFGNGWALWSILHILQRDAPTPYADAMVEVMDPIRKGSTLTKAMAAHPECFSALYLAVIRMGEIGGVPDKATVLLREMIEEEWAHADVTGWNPVESSLFLPGGRSLPVDLNMESEGGRLLLLRWFCHSLGMLLSANVPLDIAVEAATSLLPETQRFALAAATGSLADRIRAVDSPLVNALAKAGEETGRPGPAFLSAADILKVQLQQIPDPLQAFTHVLARLLEAGIPLDISLEILPHAVPSPYVEVSAELAMQVSGGATLAAAMEQQPALFPLPIRFLVRIGQDWGRLPYMMKRAGEAALAITGIDETAVPARVLAACSRLMGICFSSGINVAVTFDMLTHWAPAPYGEAIAGVLAEVMHGETISESMAKRPELFPPHYIALMRSGEYGGILDETVFHAAELLEDELRFAPLTGWDAEHSPLYQSAIHPLPDDWSDLTDAQRKLLLVRFCRALTALPSLGMPNRNVLEAAAEFLPNEQRQAVLAIARGEWHLGFAEPLTALGFLPPLVATLLRIGEPTDRFGQLLSAAKAIYRVELESEMAIRQGHRK